MKKPQSRKLFVISLGCPKNLVDTEAMIGIAFDAGYLMVGDPIAADVVIINTCGFLQASIEEAFEEIEDIIFLKDEHDFRLIVTGCLAQRIGDELKAQFPAIDAVIGIHQYDELASILAGEDSRVSDGVKNYGQPFYLRRQLATNPAWAYLRVADGCDNRCAYCAIPDIRGPLRSRPLEDIVEEARALLGRGVREINLIAQDTTRYGHDLYGEARLPELLRALNGLEGVGWLRVMYAHPAHVDDRVIEALAECEHVVKYLDLPLQHISERLLLGMNRKLSGADTRRVVETLRNSVPGIALRTTFIVGMPGETEEEFAELLDFVQTARFERLGAFAYSPEPGTPAASWPGQLPDEVKEERLDLIMRAQQDISLAYHESLIGRTLDVLVEESAEGAETPDGRRYAAIGRSQADAPEIDGRVFIKGNRRNLHTGGIVNIKIENAWEYDLSGRLI